MQTRLVSTLLTLALVAGWLLACNSADKATTQTPTSVTQPETTANTETIMEHPYPPPPAILSTLKGPDDSQVDLLKAQVNETILTIELHYKRGSEGKRVSSSYAIDQISVLDETTAKKYSVLKDQSGNYMASPLQTDQGKQLITITIPSFNDTPVSVWFKFPAPSPDTKTISVTIPEVGSYKGIPVYRSVNK
jgi:hypothetical protein